ncbi:Signal recognition particle [Klebsiella pneumoniae]|nr:Signal recognition particle [Klebsiella pneumoniae]
MTAAQAEKLASKLKKGDGFDLTDFLEQLRQMKNMGGMASLMGKLPGMGQIPDNVKAQMDDKVLVRMEAIINSMTLKERAKPEIIKGSRKRRIAAGCGMQVQDVNRLLKQFDDMPAHDEEDEIERRHDEDDARDERDDAARLPGSLKTRA